MGVPVVSWNIAKRQEPWRELMGMDADVALLQEEEVAEDAVAMRDALMGRIISTGM